VATEQIEQQMRARRSEIDRKIELVAERGRVAKQRLLRPIAAVGLATVLGGAAVKMYRGRRQRLTLRRLKSLAA